MVVQISIVFLLVVSAASVVSVQVMFEQFNQCTGNGVLDCNLRVRKVNRTMATLYGNATLNMDLGDDFIVSANLYHSSLGNNQYNHYPMKIPPSGVCKIMKDHWGDYYPYFVVYAPQLEGPDVCPITARLIHFNDMVLDERMFPPFVPPGLWKVVFRGDQSDTDKFFQMEIVFRVYPDGFF